MNMIPPASGEERMEAFLLPLISKKRMDIRVSHVPFGDSLRILEPVDIRDEVINRMRHAVKQYE